MTKMLNFISTAFDRCLFILLATLMALLVIINLSAVIMRSAGSPLVWSDELSRYLFVWLIMLGFVYASSKKAQIYIDLVDQYAPITWKKWIDTFNHLVIMVFFGFLLIISFKYVSIGMSQVSSALRWSMVWVYISFPIAFCGQMFMSIKLIAEVWRTSSGEGNTYG